MLDNGNEEGAKGLLYLNAFFTWTQVTKILIDNKHARGKKLTIKVEN